MVGRRVRPAISWVSPGRPPRAPRDFLGFVWLTAARAPRAFLGFVWSAAACTLIPFIARYVKNRRKYIDYDELLPAVKKLHATHMFFSPTITRIITYRC